MTRSLLRTTGVLLCTVALVLTGALAGHAAFDPEANPETDTEKPKGKEGNYGGCHVVAGPNYMGLSCPGGIAKGEFQDWVKANLDTKPDCWWTDKLTDAELEAIGEQNAPGPDGYTWYWQRCLKGIDDQGNIGEIVIETELVKVANSTGPKGIDKEWEIRLPINRNSGGVPSPVLVASPTTNVLVYRDFAFFAATNKDEVTVKVPHMGSAVVLRAEAEHLKVEPLGKGKGDELQCPGVGTPVEATDKPNTVKDACWYRYEESSARQDDLVYRAHGTTHWRVYVSWEGQPETLFTEFDKTAVTRIPVREVQTVVIH